MKNNQIKLSFLYFIKLFDITNVEHNINNIRHGVLEIWLTHAMLTLSNLRLGLAQEGVKHNF